jgi:hypothetical protein
MLKKSYVLNELKNEINLIKATYSKPYTPTIKAMIRGIEISIRIIKEIK